MVLLWLVNIYILKSVLCYKKFFKLNLTYFAFYKYIVCRYKIQNKDDNLMRLPITKQ